MKYKNIKTGRIIDTYGKISSPDYQEVKEVPETKEKKPAVKKSAKKE
jgi:hypothetical protein